MVDKNLYFQSCDSSSGSGASVSGANMLLTIVYLPSCYGLSTSFLPLFSLGHFLKVRKMLGICQGSYLAYLAGHPVVTHVSLKP